MILLRDKTVSFSIIVFVLMIAALFLVLRFGDMPQIIGRLLPLDLSQPAQVFRDWRIAALAHDKDLCARVLTSPLVRWAPVEDKPVENGCGWNNAIRLEAAGNANLAADPITCPMAAGLTLWLTHEVQPAAKRLLGHTVKSIKTLGSYSCRGINGNAYVNSLKKLGLPVPRSEHALANAIDIAVFELDDGQSVSVLKEWHTSGAKADFLHEAHDGACRFFRVVLGPEANAAHQSHFHLDRGPWHACR